MQDYFLREESHAFLPGAGHIVPTIASLVDAFYALELPVVFTRHLNTKSNAGALGLWWSDLIRPGSRMSRITGSLDTSKGVVLEKSQYDAFHGTELSEILTDGGIGRVVVTGVATHLCCETTARCAFVRGFEVTFPVDGTATYDSHHHLASLLNLSHGFATIVTVDGLLDTMRE